MPKLTDDCGAVAYLLDVMEPWTTGPGPPFWLTRKKAPVGSGYSEVSFTVILRCHSELNCSAIDAMCN